MLWLGTNQQSSQKHPFDIKELFAIGLTYVILSRVINQTKFENSWNWHSKWLHSMQFWKWLNICYHIWQIKKKFITLCEYSSLSPISTLD